MNCNVCGSPVDEGSAFCTICGADLKNQATGNNQNVASQEQTAPQQDFQPPEFQQTYQANPQQTYQPTYQQNPQQTYYQGPSMNQVESDDKGGFAVASFVVSIISFFCCCLGTIPAIISLILGIIGRKSTTKKWMSTAGIIISVIVIVISLILMAIYGAAILMNLEDFMNDPEGFFDEYYYDNGYYYSYSYSNADGVSDYPLLA